MECTVLDSVNCCLDGGQTVDSCCSDGTYAAFAFNSTIHVYFIPNLDLPVLELSSRFLRQHPVAALAIQSGTLGGRSLPTEQGQTLLAAASTNSLFIWVLEEAYAAAADGIPAPPPLRLISEGPSGTAEAVALSSDGLAAVGDGNSILIWDLQRLETILRLENHQSTVTALTFNPDDPDHLISAAEDRTFNVWDLREGRLLYQSTIFGSAVPACVAVESQRLVLGCADGHIRQYDLALLPVVRELQVLDVSKHMQQIAAAAAAAAQAALQHKRQPGPRTITAATGTGLAALRKQVEELTTLSAGAGQQPGNQAQQGFELTAAAEGSGCILGLQFVQRSGSSSASGSRNVPGQGLVDELLRPAPQLLVCTRRGLMLFDLGSGGVEQCSLFGQEAADVLDVIEAARQVDSSSSRSSDAFSKRSSTPISQPQQPADQQQQQQQRWLSCFKALPNVEQPAAACCFAWLQHHENDHQQQRRGAQLLCCVASGFSSSVSLLQLAPARQKAGWGASAAAAASGPGSSCGNLHQQWQLSVFQTQPLPAGSPLLAKTSQVNSSSSSSSSSKSPTKGPNNSARRSSGGSSTGSDSGNAPNASTGSSNRATWSQPPAAARAGSLNKSGPPSVASKPKSSSKGQLAEKPVTFHKKIKSSGYGFVQPKIKLGQAKPTPVKVGLQGNKGPHLLAYQLAADRQYPMDSGPPITPLPEQSLPGDAPVHGGGVLQVEFAPDGCRLLTGSTDRTARCLWLPLSRHAGAGTTFVGHNGPINSVCWSHDGEYLLSASSDRTARLWSSSLPSPLITFNSVTQRSSSSSSSTNGVIRKTSSTGSSRSSAALSSIPQPNTSTGKGGSSSRSSAAGSRGRSARATGTSGSGSSSSGGGSSGEFIGDVTAARFFYMDEVVLLTTGNKVHMFRFTPPDMTGDDDIQRLKATGSYSLAASYSSNCQSVLDIAAANSFLSTLLLLACSNRSIELVDAATMQVALTIPDAHSRPVQRLVQPAASPFVSHTREIYELFTSAAPDGVVKLWDVRSGSCVRSFTGHKHSSIQVPIGAAFSPCMRYLATGSEDKAACIYDLRSTTLLYKLRQPGQADVVADVAFHPYKPWLVVGLMNGRLQWYGDVFNRGQQQRVPGGMADRQVNEAERQLEDDFL